jgi:hypothetical protein
MGLKSPVVGLRLAFVEYGEKGDTLGLSKEKRLLIRLTPPMRRRKPAAAPSRGLRLSRALLLLLPLVFLAPRECVSSEKAAPAAGARRDSAEVELNTREPVLQRSDERFLRYAGMRLRRIRVRALDVFGASVDDTTQLARSGLARFLNHLNFRSRDNTIRQNLLFKEGDVIDPFRLAESERVLRSLDFIEDARIVVQHDRRAGDSTDVLVIVKDSWTLSLSVTPKDGNRLNVSLAEKNLVGLGHSVSGAVTLSPRAHQKPELAAGYALSNIQGSFIAGKLNYAKKRGQETSGLEFSRELISPLLNYVGGLDLKRTLIIKRDSLPLDGGNASNLVDVWTGRQVHLRPRQKQAEQGNILFASGRIRNLNFTDRPPVTSTTFYEYHSASYFLGSITLSRSRFYRTNLLYSLDRTEDVPYGFLAQLTGGMVDEEFSRSGYASVTLAGGEQNHRLGYGSAQLRIGGNPNAGKIERGVIQVRTLYFSHLLHAGEYRVRQFVSAEYTTGFHRPPDDSMNFNGDESIRGVVYDQTVAGVNAFSSPSTRWLSPPGGCGESPVRSSLSPTSTSSAPDAGTSSRRITTRAWG